MGRLCGAGDGERRRGKRLSALADWIFGGGGSYCDGCRVTGSPCATGARTPDGRLCPQIEHAPQTVAGQAAWSLAASAGIWKSGGFGALTGIDWAAARALHKAAPEISWREIAGLLRFVEGGALKGAARKAEQQSRGGQKDG